MELGGAALGRRRRGGAVRARSVQRQVHLRQEEGGWAIEKSTSQPTVQGGAVGLTPGFR